jgi:outer membrane protein assembly factor BamA
MTTNKYESSPALVAKINPKLKPDDKPAEVTVKIVFKASDSDGAYDQAFEMVELLRTRIFSGNLPPLTADGSRTLRVEVSK